MTRSLQAALILLSLTGCATHIARDDSPANDLDALAANVKRDGKPVLLPNGKEYCMEDARVEDDQDACGGDLEDALYNANRRLSRIVRTVDAFITGERTRRNPCRWWQLGCKRP